MEATEMWLRRQILGTEWSDQVRKDVLQLLEEDRAIISQGKWIGHVL